MQITLKGIVLVLIRIVLFSFGIMFFVLSFFHGLDFNLGTFAGIMMLVISLSPYNVSQKLSKLWSILISTLCFVSYSFLWFFMQKDELIYRDSSEVSGILDIFYSSVYLLPLFCLIILINHFIKFTTQD